jgi:hypothetical protein
LEVFVRLRDCLLTDKVQEQILQRGFRAGLIGMNPEKAPADVYNPAWGINLNRTISPILWPEAAVTTTNLVFLFTRLSFIIDAATAISSARPPVQIPK